MTHTDNQIAHPMRARHAENEGRQLVGELARTLTPRQTMMIGLGSALGTGLFLGSQSAIGAAGPAVILSYLAGALLSGIIMRVLCAMTIVHPVCGTFGVIAHKYLGPWAGFLIRWLFWAAATVVVGGELVASAIYVRYWWPQAPMVVVIAGLAALIVGINLISVKSFGFLEFWLSSVKVTAIVVFIAAGLLMVFVGLPHTPATGLGNLTADHGFFPHGGTAVWLAMAIVMFAFVGFETTAISAAEAADPIRCIRTATRTLVWRLGCCRGARSPKAAASRRARSSGSSRRSEFRAPHR